MRGFVYYNYINPWSSMPESSLSVAVGSTWVACCLWLVACGCRSSGLIELIIFLKSSNFPAGILNPFFVGPV